MDASEAQISERRYQLFFPRSVGAAARARLWLHGYFDALRGRVSIARQGYLTSTFCQRLVHEADLRLTAEWQESTGLMFGLRPRLEQAVRACDETSRLIRALPRQKTVKLQEARGEHSGDREVSEPLAAKRKRRRVALVEREFEERETALREQLKEEALQLGSLLATYQDVRDASETHERLVRMDYLARLSCYARGAARKVSFRKECVNDRALTTRPRCDNESYFLRCEEAALGRDIDGMTQV